MTHYIDTMVRKLAVKRDKRKVYRGRGVYSVINKEILMIESRSFIRHQLKEAIEPYQDIQLIGLAKDLQRGYELCKDHTPNIVIIDGKLLLDEELHFACKLMMMHPMQVIAIADEGTYDQLMTIRDQTLCLHNIILISQNNRIEGILDVLGAVLRHDQMAKDINNRFMDRIRKTYANVGEDVIAIGASTGGVSAIEMVLADLVGDMPPVLMVQHMSKTFTTKMAERLCMISTIMVKEAVDGEFVRKNVAYLAPGDQHMMIVEKEGHYCIQLDHGSLIHYQRPAVDRLFESVAEVVGSKSVGVLLTGMGRDGASGLKQMKESGAYTIAQDAASSVVFGMPKAAIEMGAACEVTSVEFIGKRIIELGSIRPVEGSIQNAV